MNLVERPPEEPHHRLRRTPAVPAAALLLMILLAVNAVAIWGIFSARRSAQEEAVQDLGLNTAARARALEADVASLAGEVMFLAASPSLTRAPEAMASGDPMVARWARLGAEGSLLLFVEARAEVERILVRGGQGEVLVAVGRRAGAPVVLPPEEADGVDGLASGVELVSGRWPLGRAAQPARGTGPEEAAALEVWIAPGRLLADRGGAVPEGLALEVVPLPAGATPADLADASGGDGYSTSRPDDGRVRVSALVLAEAWRPPLAWMLSRDADSGSLVSDFDLLAGRYRTTLMVNLGVVTLTVILGVLAFREVRRSSRLAAENAQQARVRELERRMMHQERLAGVGRLAAGMAHEINNPLAGMTNYLRLLEDDLERGDLDAARAAAGQVGQGLARVAGITRQVLDYSDPGRAPKGRLDLGREVAAAVDFVRESGTCPGLTVEEDGTAGPLPVSGNATTLGQLFLNLLLNACQATAEMGEPGREGGPQAPGDDDAGGSREEPRVLVRLGRRGDFARVEVLDRGPGIPEEVRPRLFEPFFSTRGSTGLGLAVCHGVVQDHGGEITAAQRPGGGAVFTVELPLAPDEGGGAGSETTAVAAERNSV